MKGEKITDISLAARDAIVSASDICSVTEMTVIPFHSYRIRAECEDGDLEFLEEHNGYTLSIASRGKPPPKRHSGVFIVSERFNLIFLFLLATVEFIKLLLGIMHRAEWPGSKVYSCFIYGTDDWLLKNLSREQIDGIDNLLQLINRKEGRAVVQIGEEACSLWVSRMATPAILATMADSLRQFVQLQLWKSGCRPI